MSKNNTYYINERALTFTPNYQGLRDVVHVSIVSGAAIAVMVPGIAELGFDVNADYQRWSLSASTTKLGTTGAYFIYARLQRSEKRAMIIFSVNDYNVDGSVGQGEGVTEASEDYWYIKIGSVTASKTDSGADVERVIEYDNGMLGTPQGNTESNGALDEMFEYNSSDKTIKVKHPLVNLVANGLAKFNDVVEFAKGIKIFGKSVSAFIGTPTTKSEADAMAASEDVIVTPNFLKSYGDLSYVSKVNDDTVKGNIVFEKSVTVTGKAEAGSLDVKGNATVQGNQTVEGTQQVKGVQTLHEGFKTANFNNAAGQITGAQLTSQGMLSVAGLEAMSFKVMELIFNVIRAQGGEYVFSPSATIDHCEYVIGYRALTVEEYYNEYALSSWPLINEVRITLRDDESTTKGNPFRVKDIIYGYVNNIGESGQYAVGGQSIMFIKSIDGMRMTAQLYQVGQYGLASNIPPADGMTIAQRGTEDTERIERMKSFYLSAETGALIMLDKVQKPTLSAENYGASFGNLPADLFAKIHAKHSYIGENDTAVYARYGIFENLIQYDHEGNPIQRERQRGAWQRSIASSQNLDERYKNEDTYFDSVTHNGSTWKCLISDTELEPSKENAAAWLQLVAKGDDGTSIKVKGSYDDEEAFNKDWLGTDGYIAPPDSSYCFIVGQDLYVWLPEEQRWYDAGPFKGADGKSQLVFIAYANSADGSVGFSRTDSTGKEYIGVYADFTDASAGDYKSYKWTKTKGEQGIPGPDGNGIDDETVKYAVSSSFSDMPSISDASRWYTNIADLDVSEGDYIWTWTRTTYTKNPVPVDSFSAARQGKDNTSVQYELLTTENIIYIEDRTTASIDHLDVSVSVQTAKDGLRIIKDNDDLANLGLKVQYSVDGEESGRTDFELVDTTYAIDDIGTEIMLGDIPLAVESTVVNLFDVRNSVELYLVDIANTDNVWVKKTVPVINSNGTLTIETDTNIISVHVDSSASRKVMDETTGHVIDGRIKLSGTTKPLSMFSYSAKTDSGAAVPVTAKDRETFEFVYTIAKNTPKDDLPLYIELSAQLKSDASKAAVARVNLQFPEQGLQGARGAAGPLYYAHGVWDVEVAKLSPDNGGYMCTDRNISYVLYNKQYYERTSNPYRYKSASGIINTTGNGTMLNPEEDVMTSGNKAWSVMTNYGVILADFIMANNARFGSKDGGVFYDRYLFSAYGITRDGMLVAYDDNATTMFDEIETELGKRYYLNGELTPNLFLDFLAGAGKFGRLSESYEPFYTRRAEGKSIIPNYIHYMDLDRSHNVSIAPRRDEDDNLYDGVVVLPPYGKEDSNGYVRWSEDGTHCTIAYQFDEGQKRDDGGYGNSALPFILVCADSRRFEKGNYTADGTFSSDYENDGTNCFLWRGWRSKFIFLPHGSVLKLRSVKSVRESASDDDQGNKFVTYDQVGLNWYVENASDFMQVEADIKIKYGYYEGKVYGVDILESKHYPGMSSEAHDVNNIVLGGGLNSYRQPIGKDSAGRDYYADYTTSVFEGIKAYVDIGTPYDKESSVMVGEDNE